MIKNQETTCPKCKNKIEIMPYVVGTPCPICKAYLINKNGEWILR